MLSLFFLEILYLVFQAEGSNFDADDLSHYRIEWKPYSQMPEELQAAKSDSKSNQSVVHMSSGDENKYVCVVPERKTELKKEKGSYSGPSPGQLIEPLHKERLCSYWVDVYWTYELCHGRYIRQFHEDKETPRTARLEYYLGNYARDQAQLEEKKFSEHTPPVRKVDDRELAYFSVTYKQGTVCDLTGKPRSTVVMYVCKQSGRDTILAFAETSSCNYEMIVLTERLCDHPAFQPLIVPEFTVTCFSKNTKNDTAKPLALVQMENEDATAFEREYSLIPPETSGSSDSQRRTFKKPKNVVRDQKKFIKEKKPVTQSESEEEDDDNIVIEEIYPAASKSRLLSSEKTKLSEGPGSDPETILLENINFCLYSGGTGWWKYEFCYQKSVVQYHEDQKTGRNDIVLGRFNEEIHKRWVEQDSKYRPIKVGDKVQEVFHIYSGGDICEKEKVHRSVVVRLRCRTFEGSQTAVSMYLTEPSTCQYVLRVESPRFCDMLQQVDEYGLLKSSDAMHLAKSKNTDTMQKSRGEL